jgi:pSer/pThr/pTyr-binding forkhead associated (FHA) protein
VRREAVPPLVAVRRGDREGRATRRRRSAWLAGGRAPGAREGDYLAFEDDRRVRVVPLQDGWTRIGRSLSAHVRFDDPTVSRRHALIYRDEAGARVLDDRSLNGVFRNGERVELAELEDGDEIEIGRFRLFYVSLTGEPAARSAGSLFA